MKGRDTEMTKLETLTTCARPWGDRLLRASLAAILMAFVAAGCAGQPSVSTLPIGASSVSQLVGSGRPATRTANFSDFEQVEILSAMRVDIAQARSDAVEVTSDDNVADLVQISKQDGTLRIGMKPGSYSNTTIKVSIRMRDLRKLELSQASEATLSGFRSTDPLEIGLRGASRVVGRLGSGPTTVKLEEASSAVLGGTVSSLKLDASGASRAEMGDWRAESAQVELRDSSVATLNIKASMQVRLRNASTLYYVGDPTVEIADIASGSAVKHR